MSRENAFDQLTQMLNARHWSVAHVQNDDIRLCAAYGIVPDSRNSTGLEISLPPYLVRRGEPSIRLTKMAQHHAVIIAGNNKGYLRVRCSSVFPYELASTYIRGDRIRYNSVFAYQSSRSSANTFEELVRTLSGTGVWDLYHVVLYPDDSHQIIEATRDFVAWAANQNVQPGDQRVAQMILATIES